MAPNTQDEQVKTSVSDIETNDRLQLKADGYLWQKVNRRLAHGFKYKVDGPSESIWTDIIITGHVYVLNAIQCLQRPI